MFEKVKRNLNGWIDCSDELPPYEKRVLIYFEDDEMVTIAALIEHKRRNGTVFYSWQTDYKDLSYDYEYVHFWQPIPIPPDFEQPFDPSWTFGRGNTCISCNADINLPVDDHDNINTPEG